MPFLETAEGVKIHWEEFGEGFPIVLVHGWAMSGRVWTFQRSLASRFRLITPDLRGHGDSSTAGGYAFCDFSADLVSLFDHLELDRAALVGWSMGAQVALEAVPVLGERVAALALVSGTPRFTVDEGWPHGLPVKEVRGLALRLRRSYGATLDSFFRSMFVDGEISDGRYRHIVLNTFAGGRHPDGAAVAAALDTLAQGDLRHLPGTISSPSLIVHGDLDPIIPVGAGMYLSAQIPGSRLLVLEGVGHAPFLSRPELFNGEMERFLKEVASLD